MAKHACGRRYLNTPNVQNRTFNLNQIDILFFEKVVDNTNILQRIFPRACAAAERLWSQEDVKDVDEASRRIEEHTCRMKSRGLPAQPPNSAGFCI